jgi:hypothetical protein
MATAENHAESGTEIDLPQPVDPRTIAVWRWIIALAFTPAIALVFLASIAATATRSPEAIAF